NSESILQNTLYSCDGPRFWQDASAAARSPSLARGRRRLAYAGCLRLALIVLLCPGSQLRCEPGHKAENTGGNAQEYPMTAFSIDPGTTVGQAALTVADLQRSERFYTEVLGMRVLCRGDKTLTLTADDATPL